MSRACLFSVIVQDYFCVFPVMLLFIIFLYLYCDNNNNDKGSCPRVG